MFEPGLCLPSRLIFDPKLGVDFGEFRCALRNFSFGIGVGAPDSGFDLFSKTKIPGRKDYGPGLRVEKPVVGDDFKRYPLAGVVPNSQNRRDLFSSWRTVTEYSCRARCKSAGWTNSKMSRPSMSSCR